MGGKKRVLPGAKRGDSYALDPENVVLVGHDKGWPVDEDDPCCDVHRLAYLNESDPKIIELAHNMIAVKENIEAVRIVWALDKKTGEALTNRDGTNVVKCSAGRRRTLAMRVANKLLKAQGQPPMALKCMPPDGGGEFVTSDKDEALKLFGMVVSENRFRLDDPPSVTAQQVARYVKMRGGNPKQPSAADLKEAAQYFGKDASTIRQHLDLDNLQPEVKQLVDTKALPANVARQLKDMPREKQVAEATKAAETKAKGGKGLLAQTRLVKQKDSGKAPADAHEGLTRGEMKKIVKMIDEDWKSGVLTADKMPDHDIIKSLFEVAVGTKSPTKFKGLTDYVNRARPKKQDASDRAAE